jgi:hypothetical protein
MEQVITIGLDPAKNVYYASERAIFAAGGPLISPDTARKIA